MACGGTNIFARLWQGKEREGSSTFCETEGSGPFSGGDKLKLSGGNCRLTKFNPSSSIKVKVFETRPENWCIRKGESVIIYLDNNIIFSAQFGFRYGNYGNGFEYWFGSTAYLRGW